ncbi:MAG: T9SS type A sorting domain-containing protein [Ignavibacteria bacterium]|nr:T9SS type A sorting domain-containing protein [Ignavibacteria bacterium]MBK6420308.1 T9SS type A sorting domain-containing protein [Ignavibacteria bacterium]
MSAITRRFGVLVIALMIVSLVTSNAATDAAHGYIENKGQIGDQYGKPNQDVRFLIPRAGLNIQLRSNGFSYDSYTVDRSELPRDTAETRMSSTYRDRPDEEVTYHFHRIDVELVGANKRPLITATGVSADYLNYYTHITQQVHGDEGATFVRGYARVTYHDVWPNIDMEWFLDDQNRPEYQFIVRPGGDVTQIRVRYHGANDTRLANGAIELDVLHGTMRERLPRSYMLGTDDLVDVRFREYANDVFGFTEPPNNIALGGTLVIDPMPELLWATYYGGEYDDAARTITVTHGGDVVVAGNTGSTSAIATAGAHQVVYGGTEDAYVATLSGTGSRLWGTFYGGSEDEVIAAVTTTRAGDIVMAGRTRSKEGIATAGAHQEVYNDGDFDAFLAVLTSAGTRLWSTYYGGTGHDYGAAVALTPGGDIVLAGSTSSPENISTEGSRQETINEDLARVADAFAVVFTSTGTRLWGTYYGGPGPEELNSVAVTKDGNIILAGRTSADRFISTSGAYQETSAGGYDAFLATFSSGGERIWSTYFGGKESDNCTAMTLTDLGDVVLVGITYSLDGIATVGAHQEKRGGNSSAFVAVFSNDGTRRWATYYGGKIQTQGLAVALTSNGNIVLGGSTQSTDSIATVGAHQESYAGGSVDAFIATFSSTGARLWGTYYGGSGADVGTALAIMPDDHVVLAGLTSSIGEIATKEAHQEQNGASIDAFVAVFRSDSTTLVEAEEREKNTHSIVSISPNPASRHTTVTTNSTSSAVLELVDVLGRVHMSTHVPAGPAEANISTIGLPPGNYYLRLVPTGETRLVQLHAKALIVVQ